MTRKWTAVALGVALAASACGNGTEEAKTVTAEGEITTMSADDRSVADLAVAALAEHLNVPQSTITVDTVRPVDWPDSSVGCPQPDQAYLQVITPGHKITLRADGQIHVVHEANGRAFVCVRQKSVSGLTNQLELVWAPQAAIARRDLASQLGVNENQIIVSSASGTTFSDTSLGCPQEGETYETRDIEGYVLRFRSGGREYTYHTDLERVIACPPFSED